MLRTTSCAELQGNLRYQGVGLPRGENSTQYISDTLQRVHSEDSDLNVLVTSTVGLSRPLTKGTVAHVHMLLKQYTSSSFR